MDVASWLFARTTDGIRWGLDRTERLLASVGNPHRRFRSVHIGGTNGKGSVAALCDAALRREGGARVGLYTSPHLVAFGERIRIDGAPVSDEVLGEAARRLRAEIEATGASFFEATTAMAFLIFAEAGVEIAIVEVGLGGRLDSTNLIRPEVAGLTNVSLDHVEHLGDSLDRIALEKAGIFKAGVPVLVGVHQLDLQTLLRKRASDVGAPFHLLDERVVIEDLATGASGTTLTLNSGTWGRRTLSTPLPGAHQGRNAAFSAELLGLLPMDVRPSWESLVEGFAGTRWPGRLQLERSQGTTWLLDVAHNAAGAHALADALRELALPRPIVLLVGILADKEWQAMLTVLLPAVDSTVLTIPQSAPPSRAWDPEEAKSWLLARGARTPVRVIPHLEAALQYANSLSSHGTVLVTGSAHTVGDVMQLLQLPIDA